MNIHQCLFKSEHHSNKTCGPKDHSGIPGLSWLSSEDATDSFFTVEEKLLAAQQPLREGNTLKRHSEGCSVFKAHDRV